VHNRVSLPVQFSRDCVWAVETVTPAVAEFSHRVAVILAHLRMVPLGKCQGMKMKASALVRGAYPRAGRHRPAQQPMSLRDPPNMQ
jgi:hypothetical protein